jgi:hypothetical protein
MLLFVLGYSCKKDDTPTPDPLLNISRTNIEVGNDVDYTDTVLIQSNLDWSISVSAGATAWLSVDPVKKSGDSTVVTIKVTAANASPAQTATLTITPAGSDVQPRQINITRKAYNLVWKKCYGGTDEDQCYGTAILPNGQFVIAGSSFSTDGDALGNSGANWGWVVRAGSDGNKLWQKELGGVGGYFRSVVASPDGGTVSAGYVVAPNRYEDLSVVKLDANGNVVWSKTYGGTLSEIAYRIINTADGGYIIAANSSSKDGDVKTNQGNQDLWVLKLDANGNLVWSKTFGGANEDGVYDITACSDGGYVVCGTTRSNNSGDVPASHGRGEYFVVKMDANGNKIWSKTYGGSWDETPNAVIADTDGSCIVTGYTTSYDGDLTGRHNDIDNDMWVMKLNKDGQIVWQVWLGGSNNDVAHSMVRLPDGNIAIGGNSDSHDNGITGNHGGMDVWVVVVNNTGKILWQKTFGSSVADFNTSIAAAADGSIVVTNAVTGNDGDVSGNHGAGWGNDAWVLKLK